jgi:hypothetical protein
MHTEMDVCSICVKIYFKLNIFLYLLKTILGKIYFYICSKLFWAKYIAISAQIYFG